MIFNDIYARIDLALQYITKTFQK